MKMIVAHWLGEYFAWLVLAVFAVLLVLSTVGLIMLFLVFLYGMCNTLLIDILGE